MPDNLPNKNQYVTVSDASKILGVSIDTIRRWNNQGLITSTRLDGKNRYFLKEELKAFKQTRPLSISEAATALSVSISTLRRLEQKGLIVTTRDTNGERLYSPKMIEEYLAGGKKRRPTKNEELRTNNNSTSSSIPVEDVQVEFGESNLPDVEDVETNLETEAFSPESYIMDSKLLPHDEEEVSSEIPEYTQSEPVNDERRTVNYKTGIFTLASFLLLTSGVFAFSLFKDNFSSEGVKASKSQVLAASTNKTRQFTVNIQSLFNENIKVNNKDLDIGTGNLTAGNVIYGITAGNGIVITPGQNPVITATATGVSSFGNATGAIKLGSGLTVTNNTLNANIPSTVNSFATVIANGTSITAGSGSDTLTFAAGNGVNITATGKTITFDSTSTASNWTLLGTDLYPNSTSDNVGIGNTAPTAKLDVTGTLKVSGATTLNNLAYTWPTTQSNGFILQTNGSGVLTWLDPGSLPSSNFFTIGDGVIYPNNPTLDFLMGGDTSASAKFGFLNVAGGSPAIQINGADVLTGTTLGTGVVNSSLTSIGALTGGSIATGFGTISTTNTITGTNITGTTGINTGAGAGTQRIDAAGNLLNISNITSTYLTTSLNVVNLPAGTSLQSNGITIIDSSRNLKNIGTTQFNGVTYTWPVTDATSPDYVVVSNSLGGLTWVDPGSLPAVNYFGISNGAVSPRNPTLDFIIGGMSSASAKFGFLNVNSGTPTIQIGGVDVLSGTTLGAGVVNSSLTSTGALSSGSIASGFGTISTLNSITGTTLNGTTGINTGAGAGTNRIDSSGNLKNIGTTQFNGIVYTWPAGDGGSGYALTTDGSRNLVWEPSGGLGTNYWSITNGSIYPYNPSLDFLIGGNSSASAKFGLVNTNSGTPAIQISGANVLTGTTLGLGVAGSNLSSTGALIGGSIASGFGTIDILNTITGTTLNGTTGINTNGTQRIDSSGNLTSIGTTQFNNITYAWPGGDGGVGYALTNDGSNGLVWLASGGLGTNYFTNATGALYPTNNALDFLIGGNSSASARFGFVNVAGGTPGLQISGVNVLTGTTLGLGVVNSSLTSTGALTGGSIANGFGDITTANTITGTVLNASTGGVFVAGNQAIDNSGNLTNIGTTQLNGVTYTWPGTDGGTGYAMTTSGTGALSWQSTGSLGTNYFSIAGGVIYPTNLTLDFLVGGNTSASAKFGFLNVYAGTPGIQIGGNTVLTGTTLGSGVLNSSLTSTSALTSGSIASGFGTISTSNTITGTVLNGTSGISSAGVSRINASGNLLDIGTTQFGGYTYTWPGSQITGYVLQTNGTSGLSWVSPSSPGFGTNFFTIDAAGTIYPTNVSLDFLLGNSATTGARFAITGVNSGTPVATLSAGVSGGTYFTADGNLQTTAMQDIILGGATTGDIQFMPGNSSSSLYLAQSGYAGIGTIAPGTTLDVNGAIRASSNFYVNGGTSNITSGNDVININKNLGTNVTVSWTTGQAGGTARYNHTSVLYNGKIYSWGGRDNSDAYLNTVDIYDIASNSWTTGAAGGTARYAHSSVLYNGKIYSWGGKNSAGSIASANTMDIYDIVNNSWSTGTAGGTGRYYHTSVLYNSKIYFWGGVNSTSTDINTLDIYDIAGNSWSIGSAGGTVRDGHSSVLYNGKIYSWGGSSGGNLNTLDIYDIAGNSWLTGTAGGTARRLHTSVLYNGKIYSWGGYGPLNTVNIYDIVNNSWSTGTAGGAARLIHTSVLYNGKIYSWGGCTNFGCGGTAFNTMDIYDIGFKQNILSIQENGQDTLDFQTGSQMFLASGRLGIMGGNVGIGTATPSATLDVNGAIRVSGNVYSSGGTANITSGNDVINVNKNLGANVAGSWSTGTPGGAPNEGATLVAYNGKIYRWGGQNSGNTMNIYDIAGNSWSIGTTGGTGRYHHTSVVYNGKIYSWGGYGPLNTVDIYDIANNSWSTGAAGGTARSYHASVLYNGKIYSWGGNNGSTNINTVDIYDIVGNSWTTGAAGGTIRINARVNAILYNGKMYIWGGTNSVGTNINTMDIYDIAGNSWSTGTAGGTARRGHTSVLYNGKIYSWGGENLTSIDIYDIANNSWSTGNPGGTARSSSQAATLYNGKMYIWGGYAGGVDVNTMDIYDIGFKQNILALQENGVDTLDFQTGSQLFLGSGRFGIMGGNVGIGTSTPGTTLDINGAIRTNNNLIVNGGITNITSLNDIINVNKNIGTDVSGTWSTGTTGGTTLYMHTSVLYNGKIYSWGGNNGVNTMDIYDITSKSWSTGAAGGTARARHTSVLYNGKIYFWGGYSNSVINTMDIYDIAGNSWSTGAAGGTARQFHTSVLYNGKMYSWGGNSGSAFNTVDIYDIAGNSWSTGTTGGTARYSHTSVLYNDKIYSWGGKNTSGTRINTMDIYDIVGSSWSTGAAGGTARDGHTSVLYNGKIYSWGGCSSGNCTSYLNTMDIYDIAGNSWSMGITGGTARYFHTSVLYNGSIYSWGGYTGVTINTMDIYNFLGGTWSTGNPGGNARVQHTSVLYNGKIYSWAGCANVGGCPVNSLDIYDIASGSWSTGASGGSIRYGHSSTLYNGKIYSWGGNFATTLNTVDIYDIAGNSWSTGAAGGTARMEHTSVLYNGKIYLWGGATDSASTATINTMDIYDVAGNSWSTGAAGGTARNQHTSVLYNGKIYSWGGSTNGASGGLINTIDIYDIAGNSWSTGTSGGTARRYFTSVLYNGKIYSWGGYDSSSVLSTVDIYDIATSSWSTGTAGGTARAQHTSVLYNGKIYSWGGNNAGNLKIVDIYDIGFKQNLLALQENGQDTLDFQTGSTMFLASGRLGIMGGNVGIGTASPSAMLDVTGTASISGGLKLYGTPTIQSTVMQNLTLGGDTTGDVVFSPRNGSGGTVIINGTTTLNNLAYTWPGADGAGAGYVLTTNGTGTLSWTSAGALGTNYFSITSGAVYPTNTTLDFVLGSNSTGSAKMAFVNVAAGTPEIQISGVTTLTGDTLGAGVVGSSLTSTGILATGSIASGFGSVTTANTITGTTLNGTTGINTGAGAGTLRIDSSGNLSGIGTISSTYLTTSSNVVNLAASTVFQTNGTTVIDASGNLTNIGTTQFNTIAYTWPAADGAAAGYALQTNGAGSLSWVSTAGFGTNYFTLNSGAIYPTNISPDFLIGASSTTSAKFAVLNVNGGTPVASLSGTMGGAYLTAAGVFQTTANQKLVLGGLTTGDIQFLPGNSSSLYLASSGNVGFGTTTPGVKLDIAGTFRTNNNVYVNGATSSWTSLNDVASVNKNLGANATATGMWSTGLTGGTARQRLGSVIYNGKMYLIGGTTTGSNYLTNVDIFDITGGAWTTGTGTGSTGRFGQTDSLYNGKIYHWGGYKTGAVTTNILDIYDIASNTWQGTYSTGGTARQRHTSILYNGKIYSWGGSTTGVAGGVVNTVDIYDIANNSWSTGAAGGTARWSFTSILYNGKIYSWGGVNSGGSYLNTMDIYDIANNSWSTGTAGGTARIGQTSVLYNGKMYSWGGQNSGGNINTMDIYDIAGNSWSTGTAGGTARWEHTSVLYGNLMVSWGGNGGGSLNTVDIYDISKEPWTTGLAGGTVRIGATSILYNGKIYSWGGYNGASYYNTVDIYDIASNSWSTGTAGGTARRNHTSVLYNGKIYSWGGDNGSGTYYNTVDIYDIAGNSWSTGTAGGTPRNAPTSTLYNGKIYSWGGYTALNTMDIYDIAGNSWSTGAAGGTGRRYHTSVLYNGKIYFWGGCSGCSPNLNTLDIYDIAGNSWSTGAAGGTPRNGHTSILYNGKIYSWGGNNGGSLNTVDIYDIAGNSWSTGTAGGTARYWHTSILYNGKIYSWGGSNGSGNLNTVDIYNIGFNQNILALQENGTDTFDFQTGSQLFLANGRMNIAGGNVGIGTATPGTTLDVSGTVRTNNNLYVNGGISNVTGLNDVVNVNKSLSANATGSWSTGTAGGTARYYHTSILYNGKIYSWGGYGGSALNTMDIYDIAGNSWSTGAAGGAGRQGSTSILYNGKMYIWGGLDSGGNKLNTVDIYDIAGNSWSTGTAGGTARQDHTSILYNGKMYSWGGINGATRYNTMDVYDIAGNSWTTGNPGGTARNGHTSVLYNGRIYSWGGTNGSVRNTMDVYDIASNSWSTGAAGGTARAYHTSILYNGKIYSWGGTNIGGAFYNTVDIYDIVNNFWSTGVAGGTARANHTSILYNGKIYSLAGCTNCGGSLINTVDIYDIGFKQNILALQENGVDTFDFQTGSQLFLANGRMGIMGGSVGIGTATPGTTLDVVGTVKTNNNLYVNGGISNLTSGADVLIANKTTSSNASGSWSTGQAGGTPRNNHKSVLYNGKIYSWGGSNGSNLNIMDIYDIASNSWSTGAAGGTARRYQTSVVYNGKIYSWGGYTSVYDNTIDIYDIAGNSWSTGAAGGTGRGYHTSVLYNGKIYSWGGNAGGSNFNTMDIYDIAGNSWSTGAAGGTARYDHTSILYNGKIYSWGGLSGPLNTMDIYDIVGNSWSTGAAGGTARYYHTSILYNGKNYSWGGSPGPLNTVDIYDIASNSWLTGITGGTARSSHSSIIYNGKIYSWGGNSYLNTIDIYDIGFKQNILSLQENGTDTFDFQTGSQLFLANGRMGIMGGSVGIGTATPGTTLDILGSVRTNNNLYVNGGISNITSGNDVINVNKNLGANATGSWSTGQKGGTARLLATSVLYNGKIYSWGGCGNSCGYLNTVDIYDIAGNTWSTGATGGTAREAHTSILYNGKIYSWGGFTSVSTYANTLDIYDIAGNSWSTGAAGGTARAGHTSVLYNGKIYSWGGWTGSSSTNTLDIYDIANNTWSTGAAGGTARWQHTSVLYNGKIYSWGGCPNNCTQFNTMDIYDIANNSWSTGAAGGTARQNHTSVLYNGKIYSWGGNNGGYLNTMDIYDIASNYWSTGIAGGTARYRHTSVFYNGKIYSWGGYNGSSLNTVDIYDIGFKQNILSLQENGQDTLNFQIGSQIFLASGRLGIMGGNVGIGSSSAAFKLDISTSTASDRGINVLNTAATGTNYGIYSSVTGAATQNTGGYFTATGATTNYGLQVSAMSGATNTGLDIGALSGATANTGVNVGDISGTGTGTSFSGGAISSTGTTNYGLTLGTMTGGTASNYQINTGILTSATTTTNAQLNLGGIVTSGGTTNYGINVGALSGTGTTNYGVNITASSATGTTNYGLNIGNITGAASGNNYGLYIGTVSGANSNNVANNFALYSASSAYSYFGGNVGIGTTAPGALLSVGTGSVTNFGVNSSGDITSGITTLNGSSTANGTGAVSTTLILNSATNFDIGNYVQVSSTDCVTGVNVCYAKITNISTNTLTISPALTWANSSAVVEVHIPEVGGTDTAATLANRYGRGYFIDGIVTGNGSSYYTDNSITFSGGAKIQNYASKLVLQAGGSGTGSTGTASVYFADSTGVTRARLGTAETSTKTFSPTGSYEDWTVPPGVTSISVVVKGGDGQAGSATAGTSGGSTTATYAVTAGQSIRAYVGRSGANGGWGSISGGTGGGHGGGQSKFTITGVDKAIAGGGAGGGAAGSAGSAGGSGADGWAGETLNSAGGAGGTGGAPNSWGGNGGNTGLGDGYGGAGGGPGQGTAGSGPSGSTGGVGGHYTYSQGIGGDGGTGGNGGAAGGAGGGGSAGTAGTGGTGGAAGGGGGAPSYGSDGSQGGYGGGGGGAPGSGGAAGTAGTAGSNSASGGTGASYGANGAGDGTIVFTYAGYGTLYTGATNTSSADVAELYHTNDSNIEAGDLVVWSNAGLDKTTTSYDKNIMGVVSTAPGVTLGSEDGADNTDKRPVALSGRVPLKVSTENGVIHSGDMLTSSSIPGVAMKATKFGTVVGIAMEDFLDPNPQDISKIEVFVNLGNNLAQTIGSVPLGSPIYMPDGTINQDYQGQILTADQTDKMITEKLAQPRDGITLGSSSSAQITVKSASDSASWTMTLPTDAGTNGSVLTTDGAGNTAWVDMASLTTPLRDEIFTVLGNATDAAGVNTIFGTLAKIQDQDIASINDKLSVFTIAADTVTIMKNVVFNGTATFNNGMQALQDIVLGGRIKHIDQDTAGFAVIKNGDRQVTVPFDVPYNVPPVINITSQDSSSSAYVKNVSEIGFTVSLPATAAADMKISWSAVLVKTPKTFQSVSGMDLGPTVTPTP